ncbi:MAG: ATP phosphoribosyltransferase regulatory subunit [Hyphomicrobiales bacterium]|nr:ATP phosphoribosyltransferase regulatory subunit [Hyphomicrobiales bacterium]PCJ96005.1 MAG: ATP phosphoribosyltransferase regulatory subunit [Hyphomicrobiales bacterium]
MPDTPQTDLLEAEFTKLFAAHDCVAAKSDILLSADPFLETAGEDLRRRMFITSGPAGEEMCLRPEFTIPVCLQHLRSGSDLPRRYGYLGPVFRHRKNASDEFLQAGVEHLGRTEQPGVEDGDIMAIALEAAALPNPDSKLTLKLGDPSLFQQLLVSLQLPDSLQQRLIRAYGRGLSEKDLNRILLPNAADTGKLPDELQEFAGDEAKLTDALTTMMQSHGLSRSAGRSPQAIAQRYMQTYGTQDYGLSDKNRARAKTIILAFSSLKGAADSMADVFKKFESEHNVSFGERLIAYAERLSHLHDKRSKAVSVDLQFAANFARPLDYYTGFVFEVFIDDATQPVAGGGRYDRLMEILGAPHPVPAVGFSLWLDRLPKWQEARS